MCPYIPDQQINTGSYIPTTAVFDVSLLYETEVTSPEFKELLVRLYQQVNNISLALNTKDSAYYILEEFVTGALYFNPLTGGVRVGITDGAGNATGTVPGTVFQVGQKFVIGAETDTVTNPAPGPQPMTSTGPSTTHTFNITNGAFVFVAAPANTAIFFFPSPSDTQQLRPEFRKSINTGFLAAGITTTPHGLTIGSTWNFSRIEGAASNFPTHDYYPITFGGAAGNNIEVRLNATNVVINNASGVTFANSVVTLWYLKN